MDHSVLHASLDFLQQSINSNSPVLNSSNIRPLLQNIYSLCEYYNLKINIHSRTRGKFCIGCGVLIHSSQLASAIELFCYPGEHFFCNKECLKEYALRATNYTLMDLEEVRCKHCEVTIPYERLNQVFNGRITEIQADATDRALRNLLNEEELKELAPKFQCQICFEILKVEEGITLDCDHRFCMNCIKYYVEDLIESAQVTAEKLKCPACTQAITPYEIEEIVSAELYQKYEKFQLRGFVLPEHEDKALILHCPGADCEFFCIMDKEAQEFECPSCSKKCCPNCKEEIHKGITCEQYQEWRMENSEADQKFEEMLKREGLMKCPNCGTVIEKMYGCQYMTCTSSKCQGRTYLCWECGQALEGDHHAHQCENRFVDGRPPMIPMPNFGFGVAAPRRRRGRGRGRRK